MPQGSIAYAVGRIRAAARRPLGAAQLDRLLASPGYDEALGILEEIGWPGAKEGDVQRLSVQMLEKACAFIREISPDPALTDAFLLRHDARNLKTLLKTRILNTNPETLSDCGTLPLEVLRHAVTERVYTKLPDELRQAMEALERRIVSKVDPMEIDVRIDQALYALIARKLRQTRSKASKQYFSGRADLQNAVSYLRMKDIKDLSLSFPDLLLPGGSVSPAEWKKLIQRPELLSRCLDRYGRAVQSALRKALQNPKAIPALEKAMDDCLLGLFRPFRNEPFAVEALIGWLLAHEREAAAVRLILAGKLNGFPQEIIRERLREAYGR